ncbi:MAG: hypothetical protein ABIT83_23840 [Massilia sp.]
MKRHAEPSPESDKVRSRHRHQRERTRAHASKWTRTTHRFACALLSAILTFAGPAIAGPAAGGRAPCESDSYHDEVDSSIDRLNPGTALLGFTAYPSFEQEWGARVLERSNHAFVLRVVEFKHSIWASAYQEKPKGTFKRNPAKADRTHAINEIPISPELLGRLRRLVDQEVGAASESNRQFGLDGTSYRFISTGRHCASAWSPDADMRAGRLVAIFDSLRALAHTPTSLLRSFREASIMQNLDALLPAK